MDRKLEKRAFTPKQAAEMFGLSVGTLANLRYQKIGPRYYRVGRKVLYLVADFEAWIMQNPIITVDSLPDKDGNR